jgi:hypothetical protein
MASITTVTPGVFRNVPVTMGVLSLQHSSLTRFISRGQGKSAETANLSTLWNLSSLKTPDVFPQPRRDHLKLCGDDELFLTFYRQFEHPCKADQFVFRERRSALLCGGVFRTDRVVNAGGAFDARKLRNRDDRCALSLTELRQQVSEFIERSDNSHALNSMQLAPPTYQITHKSLTVRDVVRRFQDRVIRAAPLPVRLHGGCRTSQVMAGNANKAGELLPETFAQRTVKADLGCH